MKREPECSKLTAKDIPEFGNVGRLLERDADRLGQSFINIMAAKV